MTSEFLKIKPTGILESKIKMTISAPYKPKVLNEPGLVKSINRIKTITLIILILGSSWWIKLFISLCSSI
jgi:hypothetical protein